MSRLGIERGNRVGYFVGASVLGRPIAYGQGYGNVFAPAASVLGVAVPHRGLVFRPVNFEQGDRSVGSQLAVHPFECESRNGSHCLEYLRGLVGQQIAHFATVGIACTEGVAGTQSIGLLQVLCQFAQKRHVVDGHIVLKGVAHIPACLAPLVALALGIAHGKSVFVGDGIHAESLGVGTAAVAVKHENQRCPGR